MKNVDDNGRPCPGHLCPSCRWYNADNPGRLCDVVAPAARKLERGEVVLACSSYYSPGGRRVLREG